MTCSQKFCSAGCIPWLPPRGAAEESQKSMEAALAHASKINLPDESCAHNSEQPGGRCREERENSGRPKGIWQNAVRYIRGLTSAPSSAGAASRDMVILLLGDVYC